jgi:outer membrane protein TolC
MWAQKKLEAEQAKWKLGQSTLFNVLTFQQDLANAELSALRAMIDYRKALVTLRERAGVLLKHYQVTPQPK